MSVVYSVNRICAFVILHENEYLCQISKLSFWRRDEIESHVHKIFYYKNNKFSNILNKFKCSVNSSKQWIHIYSYYYISRTGIPLIRIWLTDTCGSWTEQNNKQNPHRIRFFNAIASHSSGKKTLAHRLIDVFDVRPALNQCSRDEWHLSSWPSSISEKNMLFSVVGYKKKNTFWN